MKCNTILCILIYITWICVWISGWLIWDWIIHEGGFQMIRHHLVPLTQMPHNETMPLLAQAHGREEQ